MRNRPTMQCAELQIGGWLYAKHGVTLNKVSRGVELPGWKGDVVIQWCDVQQFAHAVEMGASSFGWWPVWGVCPDKECIARLGHLLTVPVPVFCVHVIKTVCTVEPSGNESQRAALATLYAWVPASAYEEHSLAPEPRITMVAPSPYWSIPARLLWAVCACIDFWPYPIRVPVATGRSGQAEVVVGMWDSALGWWLCVWGSLPLILGSEFQVLVGQ